MSNPWYSLQYKHIGGVPGSRQTKPTQSRSKKGLIFINCFIFLTRLMHNLLRLRLFSSAPKSELIFCLNWSLWRKICLNLGMFSFPCFVKCQILEDIISGKVQEDCSLLSRFLVISFADLKKWSFYYWFAFPALVLDPPATVVNLKPATQWFSKNEVL